MASKIRNCAIPSLRVLMYSQPGQLLEIRVTKLKVLLPVGLRSYWYSLTSSLPMQVTLEAIEI